MENHLIMQTTNSQAYALITGATSGIGYELAKRFAKDGFNLVLVARSKEGLLETAETLAGLYQVSIYTIQKDLFQQKRYTLKQASRVLM
jgi:uncharacterized protein